MGGMPTATAELPRLLTPDQVAQYHEEGYCVLSGAIPAEHLMLLRQCCQAAVDRMHARMDAEGTHTIGISRRGSRYFCRMATRVAQGRAPLRVHPQPWRSWASARNLLGPDTHTPSGRSFVVKAADIGMHFGWHQEEFRLRRRGRTRMPPTLQLLVRAG